MFQSTHSLRSATARNLPDLRYTRFQSTHSLRSATREIKIQTKTNLCFNPRTPCGVRQNISRTFDAFKKVSIHALLAECDTLNHRKTIDYDSFNPRTPCGVRLVPGERGNEPGTFQSTHSLRSATIFKGSIVQLDDVSIHALLAECDPKSPHGILGAVCFNPRTPCGVRLSIHGGLLFIK